MAAALSLLQQYSQEAISHLPPQAQDVLLNPLAQKAAGAVAALLAVNTVNNTLNQWVMNNWTSVGKWDSKRELVLISGGVSGIGKQVMEDLAKAGVRVVIVDINEPDFKLPTNVSFYKASVTSTESIAAAAKSIRKDHGEPTVLVNNAGVAYDQTILEEPEEKIRLTFEVNTLSHFLMVREFLPAMIRANHGHVITVASMASFIGMGEMADYCGSKASALAFHESLRQELRSWYNAPKVRTSIIHPFWVRTPLIKVLTDHESKFNQPIMTPQIVADAIVKQILSQNSGQVILPARLTVAKLVRAMPNWLQETVRFIESGKLAKMRVLKEAEEAQLKKQGK